jgi:hypothetical protein
VLNRGCQGPASRHSEESAVQSVQKDARQTEMKANPNPTSTLLQKLSTCREGRADSEIPEFSADGKMQVEAFFDTKGNRKI